MKTSQGVTYDGDWVDGKRSGNGTLATLFSVYEGGFFDDLKEGYGVLRNSDRSEYRGEWYQDQMHGSGVLLSADGSIQEGTWENGKYIGPL